MTFNTLEVRDVPKIYRMLKGLIGLVATLALATFKAAEIHRVFKRSHSGVLSRRPRRVVDYRMADVTIVGDHFTRTADMFTVVTPETS